VSKVVSVKFSPREETQRKQSEKQREAQEDRIDGSASAPQKATADKAAFGPLPHEEELQNDLLVQKEQTIAPIADAAPVMAQAEPTFGQSAPDDIKAEVQAAIAAAVQVTESVKQTVEESSPKPVEGEALDAEASAKPSPAEPQS